MLSDVEYFNSKMSKIDGSGDLGDTLIQVVNAKTIMPAKTVINDTAQPESSASTTASSNDSPAPATPEKDDNNQQAGTENKTSENKDS